MRGIIVASCLAVSAGTACSRQESAWDEAQREGSAAAYEAFIERYPAGEHARQARAALDALNESETWRRAERLGTPEAWQRYLDRWPDGAHAALARQLLVNFIPPAPPTPASAAADAAYEIQLGAWLDEATARESLSAWQGARAAELEGAEPRLVAPPAKGPALWRLRAGPFGETYARALCGRLKAAGTDCVPVAAASAGDPPP
ncbi:MAG: hypothetical protein ACRETY_05180 [Steroidobacteraceae bacterium]